MTVLLFPHQLFEDVLPRVRGRAVILSEHPLLLRQFPISAAKARLHDESLGAFAERLIASGARSVVRSDAALAALLADAASVTAYEPADDYLLRDLRAASKNLTLLPSPMFLTPTEKLDGWFAGRERVSMAEFYKWQRRRMGLLLEASGEPVGGRWSFDAENRKRLPTSVNAPLMLPYPRTHAEARAQLTRFLEISLVNFGPYEDAMRQNEERLFHSVLTPALNVGLLTPGEIVRETLRFAESNPVPIESLEGFLRQIVGWREFVHGTYRHLGRRQRTTNHFGFTNRTPEALWSATTGLFPADTVIRRVLQSGYCHHIERLMVLGNLFLLLEIHPNEVYHWFMTLFIDAFDWVMVPNIFGMSQYADGGLMTTKPYLSGSAYLRKMGDWPPGEWTTTWDALYWRFIHVHRRLFLANHRSSMMVHLFDRLSQEKQSAHLSCAREFGASLNLDLSTEPIL